MELIKELNPFNNKESDNTIVYIIKILLKTFLAYILGIICSGILVTIAAMIGGIDPSFEGVDFNVMLLFKYYGYIAVIVAFVLLTKKFSKMNLNEIGIDKNFKTVLKGMIIGIITLIVIIGILMLLKEIKFEGINNSLNYKCFFLFIGAWMIQAFMEEIICRGYLFHKLKNKTSIIIAIIISFSFFAIGHFFEMFNDGILLGLVGCINLLLPSIIWALMVLKDENIYSALGFHFIWNFVLFNIIGLNLSGIESNVSLFKFTSSNSFWIGGSYGIESSIITSVVLVVVLFIINSKSGGKNNE